MSGPLSPTPPVTPTILAVDDDRHVLGLVDVALRSAGYHVLLADGGWDAIGVYERSERPIHLLITDVIMPDLTGPVLAQRLRARQPDLQVLFISGFHDADLMQRFVTLKRFTLLPKPFTPASLLRVVEDALHGVKL